MVSLYNLLNPRDAVEYIRLQPMTYICLYLSLSFVQHQFFISFTKDYKKTDNDYFHAVHITVKSL